MTTKTFFSIRSNAAADYSRRAEWIRDLEAIPGVQRVYRVLGQYDLLVTLDASADPLPVANRILANGCVHRLVISFSPVGPALRPHAA